jgi:hypothetical protein
VWAERLMRTDGWRDSGKWGEVAPPDGPLLLLCLNQQGRTRPRQMWSQDRVGRQTDI